MMMIIFLLAVAAFVTLSAFWLGYEFGKEATFKIAVTRGYGEFYQADNSIEFRWFGDAKKIDN